MACIYCLQSHVEDCSLRHHKFTIIILALLKSHVVCVCVHVCIRVCKYVRVAGDSYNGQLHEEGGVSRDHACTKSSS